MNKYSRTGRTDLTPDRAKEFLEDAFNSEYVASNKSFDFPTFLTVLRKFPEAIEEESPDLVLLLILSHCTPLYILKEMCNKFPDAGTMASEHWDALQWTPLITTCSTKQPRHDIIRYLVERDPEVTKTVTTDGNTLLHLLCANQKASLKSIRYVLTKDPTMVTSRNASGMLPTETLAARILENGPSISRTDMAIFKLLGKQHTWDTFKLAEICGSEGGRSVMKLNGDIVKLLFKHCVFRNLDASDCHFTTCGYLELFHQCKTRKIQSLCLTIRDPMNQNRLWVPLRVMLHGNKSLTSLDLTLYPSDFPTGIHKLNYFGQFFCNAVANNTTLKHLSLYLSPQFSLVAKHVRHMISHNTSIREFEFHNLVAIGQDIVEGFVERTAPVKSLEIRNCDLRPNALLLLTGTEGCLQGIKKLSFQERSFTSISPFEMDSFPGIEELSFKYPGCEARSVLKSMVFPALEIPTLKTLVVDAQKWTTEDMTGLAEGLRESELEDLRIGRLSYKDKVCMGSIASVVRADNCSLKGMEIATRESFYVCPQSGEILHFCRANRAGRAVTRRLSTTKEEMVHVLEEVCDDVDMTYTLLRETPALWLQ